MAVADQLVKIAFHKDLLPKVQGFDCGDEPWEREVSDWLKAPSAEQGAIHDWYRGTEIWLYATAAGELVGVGTLGKASTRWPTNKDPKIETSIIPMLGVDRRFQGQPPGPREGRYSTQILSDLIVEAQSHKEDRPALILYVNEQKIGRAHV